MSQDIIDVYDQLEIIKSKKRQYGFTLRRTNLKDGLPTEQIYRDHIYGLSIKHAFDVIDYVFEEESGLHMHGILELRKNFPMQLLRVRGWNMKIEELYNEIGWVMYMHKYQPPVDTQSEPDDFIPKKCLFKKSV